MISEIRRNAEDAIFFGFSPAWRPTHGEQPGGLPKVRIIDLSEE